jgi:hypothetical protein
VLFPCLSIVCFLVTAFLKVQRLAGDSLFTTSRPTNRNAIFVPVCLVLPPYWLH